MTTQPLTKEEASKLLEGLYDNGFSIAVEELDMEVTRPFAGVGNVVKGFFVVLYSKELKILDIGPVSRPIDDFSRHGSPYAYIKEEKDLTDEVVSDSIRRFLRKFLGAPIAEDGFWKKTGSYSKEKALYTVLKG